MRRRTRGALKAGADRQMQSIVAGLAVAVFVVAAFGDIKNRRIPTGLVLVVGGLGIVRLALAGGPVVAAMTLLAAAAVLAAGFLRSGTASSAAATPSCWRPQHC